MGVEKESFTIAIKKANGNRDIKLTKMTLEDIEIFQSVLESFKNLMKLYDSKCTINVFESSAAFKSEHDQPVLHIVQDDLEKANNREQIRPGALREMIKIQSLISNSTYEFEVNMGIRDKVIPLKNYFKTENRFKNPASSRGRALNKIIFIKGELRALDESANINVCLKTPNGEEVIKINCESRLKARNVRNYYDAEVFVSVIKHETPKTAPLYHFIDNYRDDNDLQKFKTFLNEYQYRQRDDRYLFLINELRTILMNNTREFNDRLLDVKKHVLLFDNDISNEGELFTIMTTLQQYDQEDILESTLESIYKRLQKKTKMNF